MASQLSELDTVLPYNYWLNLIFYMHYAIVATVSTLHDCASNMPHREKISDGFRFRLLHHALLLLRVKIGTWKFHFEYQP